MASTPEKLKIAREASRKSPMTGKHGKAKKTIAREKAREVFELAQLKKWTEISNAQAKDAIKDLKAREYTINQVIGKPKEITELVTSEDRPLQIQIVVKESIKRIYGKDK